MALRFLWSWSLEIACECFGLFVWITGLFDCTLGFPGEGPRWSIISANVDSFATNFNCLQWDADVFMLQEARIADSNHLVESQRKAGEVP